MSTIKIKREFLPDDLGGGGGYANVGTIVEWPSDTIPENWLLCDGRAVSRNTYSDLFAVIGTQFGAGDGSTTFNLPDRKGRSPIGKDPNDTDFDTIGEKYGEKTHTLTINEIPSHKHDINYSSSAGGNGSGLVYGTSEGHNAGFIWSTGGGQAHNTVHPVEVSNFIIKASAEASTSGTIVDSLSGSSTTDAPSVHIVKDALSTKQNNLEIKSYTKNVGVIGAGVDYVSNIALDSSYTNLGIVGIALSGGFYTFLNVTSNYINGNTAITVLHNSATQQTDAITMVIYVLRYKN